jgi:hypothetical protein
MMNKQILWNDDNDGVDGGGDIVDDNADDNDNLLFPKHEV